jgi:hypothetical protein
MRRHGLGLFFGAIFLAALIAQALVGHADFNHAQAAHHGDPVSLWRYVTSSEFGTDVFENWQSEYLQFTLYIFATVWLVQKGSPESKPLDQVGPGSDTSGAQRSRLYSNSLVLVMGAIWIASWGLQAVSGRVAYNAEQLDHQQAALNLWQYLGSSDFWDRTLQNWQSEFLAVGSMAVFAIYLRQRGSPESKPVGAPHDATGAEGG